MSPQSQLDLDFGLGLGLGLGLRGPDFGLGLDNKFRVIPSEPKILRLVTFDIYFYFTSIQTFLYNKQH